MANYGYANARIRGMKSRLLEADYFDRLLSARGLPEITSVLDETGYREDIHNGLLRLPGPAGVEEGLRLNLSATFQKVLDFLDGKGKSLIEILLERWDIQNIKTIMRGKHIAVSSEEIIGSFVPAGALREEVLVALAQALDIKAVIDLMATWDIYHSKPLTRNFSAYVTTHSLSVLEVALDKNYYASALMRLTGRSNNVKMVRRVIQEQIDLSNLMILLRLAGGQGSQQTQDFFIDGGQEIDKELFDKLADGKNINEIIGGLAKTSYYPQLIRGLTIYETEESFAALERALEEQAIRRTVRLFRGDPLSLASIIAYLWAKINEIVNIRIILRAKEVGMTPVAIKQSLVLIG